MASIEEFNEHCWKDVIPEADLEVYKYWRRETFVGPRPALLAIDLYDLVYRGGPRPPVELNERYPNSCGIFAHQAIAPTKKLFAAARRAGIPIFFCTQETRPNNRPRGAVSTKSARPTPHPTRSRSIRSSRSSRTTSSFANSAPACSRARRSSHT